MAVGPGNVIEDPHALFLQAISEGASIVTHTPDPDPAAADPKAAPAAKAATAKPTAKPDAAAAAAAAGDETPADDLEAQFEGDDEDEFDVESSIAALNRKLDDLARPQAAARPAERRDADRSDIRAKLGKLREGLEPDDARTAGILEALDNLTERLDRQDAREQQRQVAAQEAEEQAWEDGYAEQVVEFTKKYPGVGPKAIAAVGRQHAAMINRDGRAKALSFEEVARRVFGDDALDARKAKRPSADNGASPATNGRTGAPSGAPIPARSSGGGPPEKFKPGPGRGVGDVTEHLRKQGAFRGVLTER